MVAGFQGGCGNPGVLGLVPEWVPLRGVEDELAAGWAADHDVGEVHVVIDVNSGYLAGCRLAGVGIGGLDGIADLDVADCFCTAIRHLYERSSVEAVSAACYSLIKLGNCICLN